MIKNGTARNNEIRNDYNSGPFGFTIRNQVYRFPTRDEYLEAFSRSLEIADKQTAWIESGRNQDEFDLEEALRDSDAQITFNFENPDPEEATFSDDVAPAHR